MENLSGQTCNEVELNMVCKHIELVLSIIILSSIPLQIWTTSALAWEFNLEGSLGWNPGRSTHILRYPAQNNRTLTQNLNGRMTDVLGSVKHTSNEQKESIDKTSQNASLILCPQIKLKNTILLEGMYSIHNAKEKIPVNKLRTSKEFSSFLQNNRGEVRTILHWNAEQHQWGNPATRGAPTATPDHICAVVQVPLGMINVGEHEYLLGAYGAIGKSPYNQAAFLTVPIGPLRFAYATRLDTQNMLENSTTEPFTDTSHHSLHAASVSYRWENLGLGALTVWRKMRNNPYGIIWSDQVTPGNYSTDQNSWINILFVRLNNGNLFAGGQIAWVRSEIDKRTDRSLYKEISGRRSARSWLAEAGVDLGPTRLSLQYATVEGRLGAGLDPVSSFLPESTYAIDGTPILPAKVPTILGAYHYSSISRHMAKNLWAMPGAYRIAGRADCALAVNLNLWSSLAYAGGRSPVESNSQFVLFPTNSIQESGLNRIGKHRAILEMTQSRNLYHSWEFNAGFHWDFMNGLTIDMQYALCKPLEFNDNPKGMDLPNSQFTNSQSCRFVNYLQWDMALQF